MRKEKEMEETEMEKQVKKKEEGGGEGGGGEDSQGPTNIDYTFFSNNGMWFFLNWATYIMDRKENLEKFQRFKNISQYTMNLEIKCTHTFEN